MAKKKKRTKKRAETTVVSERSPFWAYSGAIFLLLLAVFVLLGGFGTGGSLPVGLFALTYASLGYAAYLLPVALAYWGIYKFASEDRRIPVSKLFSMLAILIFSSSWFQVAFSSKDQMGVVTGGHGGGIGSFIGGLVLGPLDKMPASLLFFVATTLAVFFAFSIDPKVLAKVFVLFQRPDREDNDKQESGNELAALKSKAAASPLKVVSDGIVLDPVQTAALIPEKEVRRQTSFRNTASKLTIKENHDALTVASDPDWKLPSIALLNQKQDKPDAGNVNANAQIIHDTYANFNIEVEMEGANIGPTVTQYTMKPPTGVKLTKITALENNLALDLAAHSIRMEAPIPGQRVVGIEVPNKKAATVRMATLLTSKEWGDQEGSLSFVIGKDIAGKPMVADLAKMPHLLVAGQTGSGKSVMINTFLTSLLYRNSPSDLKLILVDPKQVEMAPYNDIPHLLTPVINEPEKCISALKWAVAEMERRLRTMAEVGKRNIGEYNSMESEEGMPYIVIVIDELADLMMMAANDVEALIVRLAQKARAVGIHLVLATQRPSVNVITGLIKANVPARIAFTAASQVDSRTIIDQMGAEKLLGRGDMLLKTSEKPKPVRVQAALIEEAETAKVTDFLRMQRPPQYDDEVVSQPVQLNGRGGIVADYSANGNAGEEPMYRDAVRVVIDGGKASTSLLQRRLGIGYGRAAKLIDTMEEQGIVSSATGNKPREVLVSSFDDVFGGNGADATDSYDETADDFVPGR